MVYSDGMERIAACKTAVLAVAGMKMGADAIGRVAPAPKVGADWAVRRLFTGLREVQSGFGTKEFARRSVIRMGRSNIGFVTTKLGSLAGNSDGSPPFATFLGYSLEPAFRGGEVSPVSVVSLPCQNAEIAPTIVERIPIDVIDNEPIGAVAKHSGEAQCFATVLGSALALDAHGQIPLSHTNVGVVGLEQRDISVVNDDGVPPKAQFAEWGRHQGMIGDGPLRAVVQVARPLRQGQAAPGKFRLWLCPPPHGSGVPAERASPAHHVAGHAEQDQRAEQADEEDGGGGHATAFPTVRSCDCRYARASAGNSVSLPSSRANLRTSARLQGGISGEPFFSQSWTVWTGLPIPVAMRVAPPSVAKIWGTTCCMKP